MYWGRVHNPTSAGLDGNPNMLYDNPESASTKSLTPISYSTDAWFYTAGVENEFSRHAGVLARYIRGAAFPQFDDLRRSTDPASSH